MKNMQQAEKTDKITLLKTNPVQREGLIQIGVSM